MEKNNIKVLRPEYFFVCFFHNRKLPPCIIPFDELEIYYTIAQIVAFKTKKQAEGAMNKYEKIKHTLPK